MILKLAQGTLKETPEQHDQYARTLRKAVAFTQDPKKKSELIEEGRSHLKNVLKKYEENPAAREYLKFNEAMFRSLEKFEQGNDEESIAIIDAAVIRHRDLLKQDPMLNIDVAEAKLYADDRAGAEQLLREVMKKYPEQKELLEKIHSIIDSPIPFHQRIIIAELNRKGRSEYDAGLYEDALASFRKALEIYPKHPAINLNAVQVMLKMIEAGQRSPNAYREAKQYLDASVSLEPEHPEYERKEAFKRFLGKKIA
jgi:tetratricopeptide (TPR) repeat protein